MIKFEKVPKEEFIKEARKYTILVDDYLSRVYEEIKLPTRATNGSAGYDFYVPFITSIQKDEQVVLPTGIRFVTDRDDIFLMCVPRSGLGFKYGFQLLNTTGIIDSDYQYSDNSGHIMAKVTVKEPILLEEGKAFMQGIILPFLKTDDDNTTNNRNGGFGSTDKVNK